MINCLVTYLWYSYLSNSQKKKGKPKGGSKATITKPSSREQSSFEGKRFQFESDDEDMDDSSSSSSEDESFGMKQQPSKKRPASPFKTAEEWRSDNEDEYALPKKRRVQDSWTCQACTFLNTHLNDRGTGERTRCSVCNTLRLH